MKTNLALALLAFSIIGVNLKAADLPTALPEFMNPSQLAKWNADKTAASASTTVSVGDSDVFFTGKPYLAEAGGYVFKYRTYSPEMSRWTSADPSGFPDGVNNFTYVKNNSSCFLDNDGLVTFIGLSSASPASTTTTYNGMIYTITTNSLQETSNSPSSIKISIDQYLATTYPDNGGNAAGAELLSTASNVPVQYVTTFQWQQSITTNAPLGNEGNSYTDPVVQGLVFSDGPGRALTAASVGSPVNWSANLKFQSVVNLNGNVTTTTLATIAWGFTITASPAE